MIGQNDLSIKISLDGAAQVTQGLQQATKGATELGAAVNRLGPGTSTAAAQLNMVGVSAGQAAQAMRMLPAQITDIVTGLASGQSAFTVLIQQGGQLRDSFGSVGNVFRGLASAVSPAALAVGGIVGVLAGLAVAYKKGSDEADEFRRQLTLSGNAAGATVGQLAALAQSVGGIVGGQAKAAQVLAQLAGTGQLAAAQFATMAEAAIRLERVGGPAVEKTVEAFASLAKDPLQASIRLNESTNFLTVSLYKQIKALEEQGNKAAAAALAIGAFSDETNKRTKDIEAKLGVIEQGWLGVKSAITSAKNALLEIGRDNTTEAALANARKQRDAILKSTGGAEPAAGTFSAGQLAVARARIEQLAEQVKQERAAAVASQERATATKAAIQADKDAEKAAKQHGDGLDYLREAGKAYADVVQDLQRIQQASVADATGYSKAQERIVQYFGSAEFKNATPEMRKQAVAEFERAHAAEMTAKAVREEAKAREEATKAAAKWLESVDKQIDAAEKEAQALRDQVAEMTMGRAAREALIQARLDDAAAQAEQNLQSASAGYLNEAEYQRLQQLATQLRSVADLRRELTNATTAREVQDANTKAARDMADDWRRSLTDAFRRAFESGQNFGTAFARSIGNEVKARVLAALAEALAGQVLGAIGVAIAGGGSGGGSGAGGLLQGASALQSAYNLYNGGGLWGMAYNSAGLASALGLNSATAYGAAIGTTNVAAGSQAAMLAAQTEGFGMAGTWATSQAAAVPLTGYTNATAAYQAMVQQQTLAAYGVESAGAAASTGGAGAASSLGAYMGYAALIYAAAQLGSSLYDKGFTGSAQLDGKAFYDYSFEKGKTELLRGMGLSDKWAEILGGSVRLNHLFGRSAPRLTDTGITGTLGQGGFQGEQFAIFTQKGGVFRSDKQTGVYQAPSADLQNLLGDSAKQVYDAAFKYGEALGLPTQALEKVNTALKVSFGDDTAKNVEGLQKALAQYASDLVAAYGDSIQPLRRYGEDVVQTIARVSGAITDVNTVLRALGLTVLEASVQGGQAAVALQDLFGGQNGLAAAAGGYLQNFYTDAERTKLTTDSLARTLSDVGLALPTTRDGFRALVEAQDVSTEAGRRTFATLMSVADAFASVTDAGRSAADILAEREQLTDDLLRLQGDETALRARERERIDASNRDLYDQILALRDAKTADEAARAAAEESAAAQARAAQEQQAAWAQFAAEQAAAAQRVAEAWRGVWGGIEEEIRRLRGIGQNSAASVATLWAQFATTTAAARAGDVSAAGRLPELSRSLSEAMTAQATTREQAVSFNSRLASSLQRTLLATGGGMVDSGTPGVGPDLLAAMAQMVAQAKRTADILEQFDIDGMPEVRP